MVALAEVAMYASYPEVQCFDKAWRGGAQHQAEGASDRDGRTCDQDEHGLGGRTARVRHPSQHT